MVKCYLCKINDADATNSHIITFALIKEAINLTGYKERDYEVTFIIPNSNIPKLYAGHSVIPEKLEKILENNATKKIIEKYNPLSRDHIFCISCEKAIGKIESLFIDKVYNKLIKQSFDKVLKDSRENGIFELSEFNSKLTKLLAYSLFFRTSLIKLSNVTLKFEIHENIRTLMLSIFDKDQKTIEININKLKQENFIFPLIVIYLDTDSKDETGQNIVIQNKSETLYFIWANRMIFQLFQKESHIQSSLQNFYGLNQIVPDKDYNTSANRGNSICILSNDNRAKLVKSALSFLVEENMQNAKMLLKKAFNKLFRRNPTFKETNAFLYNYSRLCCMNKIVIIINLSFFIVRLF